MIESGPKVSVTNKNTAFILCYAILAVSFLFFIEQSLGVSYYLKTFLKVLLLLVVPLIYSRYILKEQSTTLTNIGNIKARELIPGFGVGLISFVAILAAYNILGRFVDFTYIKSELQNKLGITAQTFLLIGLYIIFINSLIEEYFFRKYIFLNLYTKVPRLAAYVFSSLLFALYHMAIFAKWFTLPFILISIFSLFVIGLIFNYMNVGSGHFLNSWLAHMLADLAIVLIGLRLFNLI